jgi:hypothetical protein
VPRATNLSLFIPAVLLIVAHFGALIRLEPRNGVASGGAYLEGPVAPANRLFTPCSAGTNYFSTEGPGPHLCRWFTDSQQTISGFSMYIIGGLEPRLRPPRPQF